jgi:hypothetical protein
VLWGGRPALGGPFPTLIARAGPPPLGGPDIATYSFSSLWGVSATLTARQGRIEARCASRVEMGLNGQMWFVRGSGWY